MHSGVDNAVALHMHLIIFLRWVMYISRKAAGEIVIGSNRAVHHRVVIQIDMLSIAHDAAHVCAIIFYASGAVGHAAVADGGKMNGASARCFLCIAAENAAVADAGIEQVVVDENQVAYLRPPPDIGEQCAAAASGYAIAVADDMALTMEGGVLDVVVATRDGEILVVKVDVALQIHVARTAV